MKTLNSIVLSFALSMSILVSGACSAQDAKAESNIKVYSFVWEEIMTNGKLDTFNETYFTKDVIFHASPENIVGIDAARDYYANYLTGFSDVEFIVNDVFAQGDKLVKHWTFKGKHTGDFFGIEATGNTVSLVGVTLVRMEKGKIAEETDFFDNLEFSQQLGLIPR